VSLKLKYDIATLELTTDLDVDEENDGPCPAASLTVLVKVHAPRASVLSNKSSNK
jgi:hypothetical protein